MNPLAVALWLWLFTGLLAVLAAAIGWLSKGRAGLGTLAMAARFAILLPFWPVLLLLGAYVVGAAEASREEADNDA
jgi:hypothetical protein